MPLLNENIDRCFVVNYYSKFDKTYNFIISEYAKDLYTPESLLKGAVNDLKTHKQYIEFTIDDIKRSNLKEEIKEKFVKCVPLNYKIYILYFDPINEIQKLNWKFSNKVYEFFLSNKNCPAASFFSTTSCLIVLNSLIIDIFDSETLELQLDHELNHIFGKVSNDYKKYETLDNSIQCKIISFLKENKIIGVEELITNDFSIHMFSKIEFISMLSNVCNVISFQFKDLNEIDILHKFMEMTSESFIKSSEFPKLEEPIRGALIFAFICRKFNPDRWNRVIKAVKEQLNLNSLSGSVKLFINKIKENLKTLLK